MRKIFTITALIISLSFPAWPETVSGVVFDSVTGLPIAGVKVKMPAMSCSTETGKDGHFSLSFFSTGIASEPSPRMKVLWDPERSRLPVRVVSANGQVVSGRESFPSGVYLFIGPGSGRGKFLHCSERSQKLLWEQQKEGSGITALAKRAASVYGLDFSKPDYKPVSLLATPGVSLEVELPPVAVVPPPKDSAKVDFQVKVDSSGTVKVKVIIPNP